MTLNAVRLIQQHEKKGLHWKPFYLFNYRDYLQLAGRYFDGITTVMLPATGAARQVQST
jgi:hypothetical protein